jgi:hypothetical protein
MRKDIARVVFERPEGARTWAKKTPRAAADVRSTPGGEIRDHMDSLVDTKCWMERL